MFLQFLKGQLIGTEEIPYNYDDIKAMEHGTYVCNTVTNQWYKIYHSSIVAEDKRVPLEKVPKRLRMMALVIR